MWPAGHSWHQGWEFWMYRKVFENGIYKPRMDCVMSLVGYSGWWTLKTVSSSDQVCLLPRDTGSLFPSLEGVRECMCLVSAHVAISEPERISMFSSFDFISSRSVFLLATLEMGSGGVLTFMIAYTWVGCSARDGTGGNGWDIHVHINCHLDWMLR